MRLNLTSIRRAVDLATRPSLLTWQGVFIVSTISALGHLGSSSDIGVTAIPLRVIFAIVSVQPLFLLLWLVRTFTSNLHFVIRVTAAIFAFMVTGAFRGWALTYFLVEFGLIPSEQSPWRILNGVITVTAIAMLQTYIASAIEEIRSTSSALKAQSKLLENSLIKLEAESQTEASARAIGIAESIFSQLQEIDISPKELQVNQIRNLVDEQVRPLTQELSRTMSSWKPEKIHYEKPRVLDELRGTNPIERLHVGIVGFLLAVSPYNQTRFFLGANYALLLAFLVWVTFTLTAPRLVPFTNILTNKKTGILQILMTVVALEVVTLPTTIVTTALLIYKENAFTFLYTYQVILITTGASTILGRTFVERAENQISSLKLINRQLKWTIARINLIMWFNQGITARLLHGPIQNALQASLIRAGNQSVDVDVTQLIVELRKRIESIEGQNALRRDTVQELRDIEKLWLDIADVNITLDGNFLEDTQTDLPAIAIVLDLVQETISNSIRHGKAKSVSVGVAHDSSVIALTFTDDGSPRAETKSSGMGSKLLNDCSVETSLKRIEDRNYFYAEIPLLQSH